MLSRSTRAGLVAAGVTVTALYACSTPIVAPIRSELAVDAATAPCPATLELAATGSCSVEGQFCPYLYPCTPIAGSASCLCTGGRYTCTGPDGGGLGPGSCPVLSTTEACPATETSAQGLFCTESGLVCVYPSACDGGVPAYDSCQCVGGRIDADIPHFECASACAPTVIDASSPRSDAASSDADAQTALTDGSTPDAPSSEDGTAPPSDGAAQD
jgi:hypothetical protein